MRLFSSAMDLSEVLYLRFSFHDTFRSEPLEASRLAWTMADDSLDTAISSKSMPVQEPETRGFFERIKDVVGEENFERDFGLLQVERACTARFLTGGRHITAFWQRYERLPTPESLKLTVANSESKHGILLIEEMGRQWFELLDATFGLDPLFVFAYAEGKERTSFDLRQELLRRSYPVLNSGLFPRGVKDKWCVLHGKSNFKPDECGNLEESDSRSYWRQRSRQEPEGILRSVAALCRLSPHVCKQGQCAGRIINAFADERLDLIITEDSPGSDLPRGFNLLKSSALGFSDFQIPWSLHQQRERLWYGYWYDLREDLIDILCNTSDGTSSFNLGFNLLFGIGNTTKLPENAFKQGLDLPCRFALLLLFTARRPLQRTISRLSDQLSEARYKAQTSPSSDTYLSLLALRRTLAELGLLITRTKGFASLSYEGAFDFMQQSPKLPIAAIFAQLDAQCDQIHKDLKEEIHLTIGAVTVQDADLARQQSERATLLTLLAAIYLPLTLVTGIFGMNIRDIDDGRPQFWWCMVVLVVIIVLTLIAYTGFKTWQRKQYVNHEQRRKDNMEKGLWSFVAEKPKKPNRRNRFGRIASFFKGKGE